MARLKFHQAEPGMMEESQAIEIVGGPNDWNMWLCMRGTRKEVTFTLRPAVIIPPCDHETKQFAARIREISRAGEVHIDGESRLWKIAGEVIVGGVSEGLVFVAEYDSELRHGELRFRREEGTRYGILELVG